MAGWSQDQSNLEYRRLQSWPHRRKCKGLSVADYCPRKDYRGIQSKTLYRGILSVATKRNQKQRNHLRAHPSLRLRSGYHLPKRWNLTAGERLPVDQEWIQYSESPRVANRMARNLWQWNLFQKSRLQQSSQFRKPSAAPSLVA